MQQLQGLEFFTSMTEEKTEFFRDRLDNRNNKQSLKHPDLKYRITKESLLITKESLLMDHRRNLSWVDDDLHITMASTADAFPPALIWECMKQKDLSRGSRLHHELLQRGLAEKDYSDALITMYARCDEPQKAQKILDIHSSRSTIPWTALIASYTKAGQGQNALDCFEQMQHAGISPDAVTYVSVLKACAALGAIDKGKLIHNKILRQGILEHEIVLGGALVDMYAKCGALSQAQSVFDSLSSHNVVSWSSLIASYARDGLGQNALNCYEKMQSEGIPPDTVTYVSVLKACAVTGAVDKGKQIHDEVSSQGLLEREIVLGGALVDMYAKCGALSQAQAVLEKLSSRNVVCWSALIAGYTQKGQGQRALECVERMQHEGVSPNAVTYVCILKACAEMRALEKGKHFHDEICRQGLLEHDTVLGGALVDMYAKCGDLTEAQNVLDKLYSRNVISWNALIAGYAQKGQGQSALKCFKQMQLEGISPDAVTYACILKSCAAIRAIDKGKQIHADILRQGFLDHSLELGGALVDMYAKLGDSFKAQRVLEKLPLRDVVSWNALLAGYAQMGQGQQALECFQQMQHEGFVPDAVTYACILKSCTVIGGIDMGKQIHDEITRQGLLEHDIVVGGALVDMYAKCGALLLAESVLEELPSHTVVSWNALITGYAQEGQGEQAMECFIKMQSEGILPDIATFGCLLNLCSHLGLVAKGQELFDTMGVTYNVRSDVECITCMVDLLGRAGSIVKAVELIEEMPCPADSGIWRCLLGACLKWVDVNVGTWAFEQALELDRFDGAAYVLMVNIYAAAGMLEKAKDIEALRIKNRAWKQPVCNSWMDVNATVHELCVGITNHAQHKEMMPKLITRQIELGVVRCV